jgi:hypothetical protein
MSTYEKNIHYLKEAIFAKLNNDTILRNLLGEIGRIFHRQPPSNAKYPCITYALIIDNDNPFNETQDTGGKITESYFRISIFSNNSKTEEADNIEARVKILLHGQTKLDTAKIICYSCFRDNLMEPIKDPKTLVWVTPVRYRTRWTIK